MLAGAAWPELEEEEEEELLATPAPPELEAVGVVSVEAAELDASKGRFIFRICSMSDPDRARAFSLKRFALAWLHFSVLMTLRRSSRMR